jgi:hypothetical protein
VSIPADNAHRRTWCCIQELRIYWDPSNNSTVTITLALTCPPRPPARRKEGPGAGPAHRGKTTTPSRRPEGANGITIFASCPCISHNRNDGGVLPKYQCTAYCTASVSARETIVLAHTTQVVMMMLMMLLLMMMRVPHLVDRDFRHGIEGAGLSFRGVEEQRRLRDEDQRQRGSPRTLVRAGSWQGRRKNKEEIS